MKYINFFTLFFFFSIIFVSAQCNLNNAPPGYYIDVNSCTYVIAPPGTYSPGGNIEAPIACNVGTFSSTPGSTICLSCAPGTFQSNPGSTECILCNAGTFQPNSGSFSCIDCAPGTFQSNQGSVECSNCPIGTYSSTSGSIVCINCPEGTSNSTPGSTSCNIVLDVSENSFKESIKYYPNPSQSKITFDFDTTYPEMNVEITDIFGRKILKEDFKNVYTIKINIDRFSTGIYYFKLSNKNKRATIKVIKN